MRNPGLVQMQMCFSDGGGVFLAPVQDVLGRDHG